MSTTIIGNVVADPELRFVSDGNAVVNFSVAVKERVKEGAEPHTSFFDCTLWGDIAENFANSVKKGDRVIVTGRLKQRTYEAKDGTKRSAVELQAEGVGIELRFNTATAERKPRESF